MLTSATRSGIADNEVYQYLLLIAADGDDYNVHGIKRGKHTDSNDLRRSLPSPMDDKGYMALLSRTDIFHTPESLITEYVY